MMTIERDGEVWSVNITRGYVCVRVPLFDDEGAQRSIDFPRVGYVLHGSPLLHRSAAPFLRSARKVAKTAIGEYEYARRKEAGEAARRGLLDSASERPLIEA